MTETPDIGELMDLAAQQREHPERLFHAFQAALGGMIDLRYGRYDDGRYEQKLRVIDAALRHGWKPGDPPPTGLSESEEGG